jgi:hypothetical protein
MTPTGAVRNNQLPLPACQGHSGGSPEVSGMTQLYEHRQHADNWPRRGRWNPADLPDWYLELLSEIVGKATAWRDEHDPGQQLDPRTDPRAQRYRQSRRAVR